MSYTVLLHINNEDPIVGEVEELPSPADTVVVLHNPRRRDGKDVRYLQPEVTTVIWPITRLNFVEIMPSEDEERIVGFVRE